MNERKPSAVFPAAQAVLNKLFSLHAIADALALPEVNAWALRAQDQLVSLLEKIPRDDPIKPLIPKADPKP